jgi:prolyl-tRNA synthetase
MTKDKSTLVIVWYPDTSTAWVRTQAIKSVVPDLDASIDLNKNIESVLAHFSRAKTDERSLRILNLVDGRLPQSLCHGLDAAEVLQRTGLESLDPRNYEMGTLTTDAYGKPLNLLNISSGDQCPKCINGKLRVDKAIELGHTFHLGTRYSKPFDAKVEVPCEVLYERETPEEAPGNEEAPANEATVTEEATSADEENSAHRANPALGEKPGHGVLDPAYRLPPLEKPAQGEIPAYEKDETEMVHMEMGCHGIGVSRLMAAVAHHNADDHSLNWPRKIAPYDVVIIPRHSLASSATEVYDGMTAWAKDKGLDIDIVIDDRSTNIGRMFSDANLVGYPIIVVVDRAWQSGREVEVQCRRLGISERRTLRDMPGYVHELLSLCK